MTIYIICHDALPNYPLPPDSRIIWLNPKRLESRAGLDVVNGYDFFEDGAALHQNITSALGPMVIRRVAEAAADHSPALTIWQYRKFVTRTHYGQPTAQYLKMLSLTEEAAKSIQISDAERTPDNFLLCPPVPLGNMYKQYVHFHRIPDLLRYIAIAVELGVLGGEESLAFFNSTHLISGGIELGTFPAQWWIGACRTLESVTMDFAARHRPSAPDDPYQKRAASFCQERLGSHLLFKELTARYGTRAPAELYGTLHSVAADGIYRQGAS